MRNGEKLFSKIAALIESGNEEYTTKIAVDGIDASGKTIFADVFAKFLMKNTDRQVIRASIDGFHNPVEVRLRKGELSPEGYYGDSFDYNSLKKFLLDPLMPDGERRILKSIYDYRSKKEVNEDFIVAKDNSILIFDGIFLLRSELADYWDVKIFLKVSFETALQRALKRDIDYFDDEDILKMRYMKRYFPGQELYLNDAHPEQVADIIIDNNDLEDPEVMNPRI